MFVVWFEKHGVWHWVEIYQEETANIVRQALRDKGYHVTDGSLDPRKYSVVENKGK